MARAGGQAAWNKPCSAGACTVPGSALAMCGLPSNVAADVLCSALFRRPHDCRASLRATKQEARAALGGGGAHFSLMTCHRASASSSGLCRPLPQDVTGAVGHGTR